MQSVRSLFHIDSDLLVPVFTERDAHVPDIDPASTALAANSCCCIAAAPPSRSSNAGSAPAGSAWSIPP